MRRGRFRFGRFFGGLAFGFNPFCVKDARFIDAFVRVRAEEITLRLQEIRRQSRLTITVEIGQRGGKCRDGHAMFDGRRYRDTPIPLCFPNDLREIAIEQEIVQRRVALVRPDDPVEKFRANDAPASPDGGDVAEIEVPLVFSAP